MFWKKLENLFFYVKIELSNEFVYFDKMVKLNFVTEHVKGSMTRVASLICSWHSIIRHRLTSRDTAIIKSKIYLTKIWFSFIVTSW